MKRFTQTVFILLISITLHAQLLELEQFSESTFSSPVDIANDGSENIYIVERSGVIKILRADGSVASEPFLDIDERVYNVSFNDERGLLGMAFHPDYTSNGFVYLNYIDNSGTTTIARYTTDPLDADKLQKDSEKIILQIEQPDWNHNGGCLKFGADGFLNIGMGDGGAANDPWGNGQNPQTMLGKMLRIDVDNGDPYSIPEDNPFVGDSTTLDEIWAIGMRNPWRFSFDSETGDLWIGDVGQGRWEEIDYEPADSPGGLNYGWRCYEGDQFTNLESQSNCEGDFVDPVFQVGHTGPSGPCSITGGFVYRGSSYPDLFGKYICADFCSGDFYIVEPDSLGGWLGNQVTQLPASVSTFGEDATGQLYIADFSSGKIFKVVGEEELKYEAAESVEYDEENDRWLVSNGDNIIIDDGQGNIDQFGEGSTSHGIEIVGENLIGLKGSEVIGYSLITAEEVMRLDIEQATFLNGFTHAGESILYATDFEENMIFKIDITDVSNPTYEEWAATNAKPNGILHDGLNNRLLYTTWEENAKIIAVDLVSKESVSVASPGVGFIDGISNDISGYFYVSSWNPGDIIRFNNDFSEQFNFSLSNLVMPADIDIDKDRNIIGIPLGDQVIFYEFTLVGTLDLPLQGSVKVLGNPVSSFSTVYLDLEQPMALQLSLIDAKGRQIKTIINKAFPIGQNTIKLNASDLPQGTYSLVVTNDRSKVVASHKLIKL